MEMCHNQNQWDASLRKKNILTGFLTMSILTEFEMNEKSQPFDHSISCHLNYAQYFVLSDLTMQSLFNDDFQLLFRIY